MFNRTIALKTAIDRAVRGKGDVLTRVGDRHFTLANFIIIKKQTSIAIATQPAHRITYSGLFDASIAFSIDASVTTDGVIERFGIDDAQILRICSSKRTEIQAVIALPLTISTNGHSNLELGLGLQSLIGESAASDAAFLAAACISFIARRYLGREHPRGIIACKHPFQLVPNKRPVASKKPPSSTVKAA